MTSGAPQGFFPIHREGIAYPVVAVSGGGAVAAQRKPWRPTTKGFVHVEMTSEDEPGEDQASAGVERMPAEAEAEPQRRDWVLVGERGDADTCEGMDDDEGWVFCGVAREAPATILNELADGNPFAIDGVVGALTGEVLKGHEALRVSLYDPDGVYKGSHMITGEQQIPS